MVNDNEQLMGPSEALKYLADKGIKISRQTLHNYMKENCRRQPLEFKVVKGPGLLEYRATTATALDEFLRSQGRI
jgi:hypothetical protein